MKKVLLVLIPLIALVGGYYYYQSTQGAGAPALSIPGIASKEPMVQKGDFLTKVRGNSLGVIHFSKSNFQPLVSRALAFGKKISESAVWKKMQLDKAVEQNVSILIEGQLPSDVSDTVASKDEGMKFVEDLWTALRTITVVVSDEKFEIADGASIPKLLLRVDFENSSLAEPFITKAKEKIVVPSDHPNGPFVVVDANDKNLYRISGQIKGGSGQMEKTEFGAARFNDSSMHYYLGSSNDDDFTTKDEADSLMSTSEWKKLSKYVGSQAAILYYGQLTTIARIILEGINQIMPEEEGKEVLVKMLEMMKDSQKKGAELISFGGLDVSDRMVQKMCFSASGVSNEATEKVKAIMFAPENQLTSKSQMMKLLSANTVLAMTMSSASFKAMFEQFDQAQSSIIEMMSKFAMDIDDPEMAEAFESIDIWKNIANAGLKNAGFFINKGMIPTSPDVFLYVDTEPGKATELMSTIQSELNKIKMKDGPVFKTEALADGSKKYVISLEGKSGGTPLQLSGSAIKDDTILFSSNEMGFGSGSQALLADNAFLTSGAGKALGKEIDGTTWLFLLSTRPVVQLATMFQGFVQGELDSKGISAEDVELMKSYLSFDYVYTQKMLDAGDGVTCTVSKTLLME